MITFVHHLAHSLLNMKQCCFSSLKKAGDLADDFQIAFIVIFDCECIVKALIILLLVSFELILSLILFYMMPIF